MVFLQMQNNLIDGKNTLNRMVNSLVPEEFGENGAKEAFDYQLPQVRASFTFKVAPDPAAESPQELDKPGKDLTPSVIKCASDLLEAPKSKPPDAEFVAPDNSIHKPCVTVQPSVIEHPHMRPVVANRSSQMLDDDKDFEIPLEESLRAVEEFIKREKELSKWTVGEDVLAKWKGNGLYYKAKILEILPSGIIIILFDTYEVKDEIDYKDICKFFKKTNNYKKKGGIQGNLIEDVKIKERILPTKHMTTNKLTSVSYKRKPCFVGRFKRTSKASKKIIVSPTRKISQRRVIVRPKKLRSRPGNIVARVGLKMKK